MRPLPISPRCYCSIAGDSLGSTLVKTTWIVRGGLIVCLCVAIFGLFERFVLPLSFWGELHLPQYLVMKGGLPFVSANGIEAILGSSFGRRLIGPFAYPLNASYFFETAHHLEFRRAAGAAHG